MLAHTAVALLPVLLFLLALVLMDSFKLARPLDIALAIACGAASAFLCDLVHTHVFAAVPTDVLVRYIAPVTEESAKAVFIAYLILRRRIGFLIDAAQVGFAAGAGFALIENIQYLRDLRGAGLGAAIAIHSAFNHLPLPPLAMTALLMLVLPLLILAVFSRNERATRDWVVAGLDLDIDLLALVTSEHFATTRLGAYLRELRARFPGPVVADMFCLLRVELELSIQAKALLIAREAGLAAPVHEDAYRGLEELHYLRGSIGPTGLLALRPLNVTTHRDEWHRYLLKSRPRAARTRSL